MKFSHCELQVLGRGARCLLFSFFSLASVLGLWGVSPINDNFDSYEKLSNRFTELGELDLSQRFWHGPIRWRNEGAEAIEILDVRSLSQSLEVVAYPEMIDSHEMGIFEVVFTPRNLGWVLARVAVTSNRGEHVLTLRARVHAEHPAAVFRILLAERTLIQEVPTVSATEAMRALETHSPEVVLIDPRSPMEFEKARAVGSLNLPEHAILYRDHLRGKRLFVIDEGFATMQSRQSLRRLASQGFNVAEVEGGIRSWAAAGGRIEGTDLISGRWARLSPSQVFGSERLLETNIIHFGGPSIQEALVHLFPDQRVNGWRHRSDDEAGIPGAGALGGSSLADSTKSGETLAIDDGEPEHAYPWLKWSRSQPVLVMLPDAHSVSFVENRLVQKGFNCIYYLVGGWAALERYLKAQRVPAEDRWWYFSSTKSGLRDAGEPKLLRKLDCGTCD